MWVGLLTDRINIKLERSNLINEHALNREPVPLNNDVRNWFAGNEFNDNATFNDNRNSD